MNWIKSFRYQIWQYRRFHFGFFESLYWAARKATDVERSARGFSEWMSTQQGVHPTLVGGRVLQGEELQKLISPANVSG